MAFLANIDNVCDDERRPITHMLAYCLEILALPPEPVPQELFSGEDPVCADRSRNRDLSKAAVSSNRPRLLTLTFKIHNRTSINKLKT